MNKETEEVLLNCTSLFKGYSKRTKTQKATCFFCKNKDNKVFLVTNKHIVQNINKFSLTFSGGYEKIFSYGEKLKIKIHPRYDLCIFDFTDVFNKDNSFKVAPIDEKAIISDFTNFAYIEEIFMIGYPKGIITSNFKLPVCKKGITATGLNDSFNSQNLFLTDIYFEKGFSGAPIYYVQEKTPLLVGVNYGMLSNKIPVINGNEYHRKRIGTFQTPIPLGIAIKSNVLKELINSDNS